MGEVLTRRLLFDGRGSSYAQLEKIYERLGDPAEHWPEARALPLWNELRPRKNHCNMLEGFLRQHNAELTPDCLDLLQKLLAYNPERRLSAREALEHPFFASEPRICAQSEFPQFKKEFHHLLLKQEELRPPVHAERFNDNRHIRTHRPEHREERDRRGRDPNDQDPDLKLNKRSHNGNGAPAGDNEPPKRVRHGH